MKHFSTLFDKNLIFVTSRCFYDSILFSYNTCLKLGNCGLFMVAFDIFITAQVLNYYILPCLCFVQSYRSPRSVSNAHQLRRKQALRSPNSSLVLSNVKRKVSKIIDDRSKICNFISFDQFRM
jgi:hypothetical protein